MAAFALIACSTDTDPGPGGVNKGDAKALDQAAQMLDERQNSANQPEPPTNQTN